MGYEGKECYDWDEWCDFNECCPCDERCDCDECCPCEECCHCNECCSCDCAKCCEFGEYQITKTTESSFRFFTFLARRLMLMCLTWKYICKSFSVISGILISLSSISDYYHCHSLFCKEMAVVEAILAMTKEASPRLYVLDALVTFDGRDDSTPQ